MRTARQVRVFLGYAAPVGAALLGAVLVGALAHPWAYTAYCVQPRQAYACAANRPLCGPPPPAWAGAEPRCWATFPSHELAWLSLLGVAVLLVVAGLGALGLLRIRNGWFVALAGPLTAWALWWPVGIGWPGRDAHLVNAAALVGAAAYGLAALLAVPVGHARARTGVAVAVFSCCLVFALARLLLLLF